MRAAATHALAALALLVAALHPAVAATSKLPLPVPGTQKQVAALVAASRSITSFPSTPDPALADVPTDRPNLYFKMPYPDCATVTSCVYGNLKSKKVLVLFGDSHAWMWLPAIYPTAKADGYKVVLVYLSSCPAAMVTYWNVSTHAYETSCTTARAAAIAAVKKLAPKVVLLASMTARRYSAPNVLFTAAQWRAGLDQTIAQFKSRTTKVAVIGDMPTFDAELPECLAAYPAAVQSCGVAIPNPVVANRGLQGAEAAAARKAGVEYVNTLPWMCSATWCSPVIGNMVVDLNQWHVDATFAEYLAGVFAKALAPLL